METIKKQGTQFNCKPLFLVGLMFIITLFMLSFTSAVTWNSTFNNGLQAYWDFSNSISSYPFNSYKLSYAGNISNVTGIIGTAVDMGKGTNNYVNVTSRLPSSFNFSGGKSITINFWIKVTSTCAGGCNTYLGMYGVTSGINTLNYQDDAQNSVWSIGAGASQTYTRASTTIPQNVWRMETVVYNGTTISAYENGTLVGIKHNDTITSNDFSNGETKLLANGAGTAVSIDEIGVWNRSLSAGEISLLWNSGAGLGIGNVFLNSPEENYQTTLSSISFNCSTNLRGITNISLWDNSTGTFKSNQTQVRTGNSNESIFTNIFPSIGNYKWTCQACNNSVCLLSSENRTISIVNQITNAVSYSTSALELSSQTFSANISYRSSDFSSISAYLNYNNTRYSSTISGTGDNVTLTNSIYLPAVNNETIKSFLWEISLDGTNINTSSYNQTVSILNFGICSSTLTKNVINFTTKNAENPYPIINATFKTTWVISTTIGGTSKTYVYEDITEKNNTFSFCTNSSDLIYADAQIEYDATGYALNNYFLENATLTNNSMQVISLYLLNDSKATVTTLQVLDRSKNPEEGVTISIQAYDVGTGTFYTVAMAKTDFNGEDISYLNWYDTLYKFTLTRGGVVLLNTNTTRISATPVKISLIDEITLSYEKFNDFVYTLYYNNATKNFVVTFTKPSGLVTSACLKVVKRGGTNDTTICNTCETSTSATLSCYIGTSGNGTFIAHFYAYGSIWGGTWIDETIGGNFAQTIYDLLGHKDAAFYAYMFSGITMAMFFVNPVLGILGLMLGILGGSALGFTILNYGQYISILVVGFIIMWWIKR